jgi:plasmid stabilization system protein ParE
MIIVTRKAAEDLDQWIDRIEEDNPRAAQEISCSYH